MVPPSVFQLGIGMLNSIFGVTAQDARAALRVAASVGVPLLALYLTGHLDIAVYAAFGALASLYGHSETAQSRAETQVVVAIGFVATVAAAVAYSAAGGPLWLLGALLFAVVVGAGTLGTLMGWVPRGEIFFILVLLVIADIPVAPDRAALVIATSAGGAGFAVLLTLLGPQGTANPQSALRALPGRLAKGSAALDLRRHVIIITTAAVATVCAWALALALGIGHPFWAAVVVGALMPALASPDALARMLQLILGTLGGVGVAAGLFATQPGPLALVLLIVVLQGVAELFIARSYGIALLFISPLAIGMSNLGRGLPWPPLVFDRLVEAGIGTAVAVLAILAGRILLGRLLPERMLGRIPGRSDVSPGG
ncbi:MAG: FUSC family protein [Rhizobiales bacterium]|nr:FUSC family protein [Hyphomicrobiales bacterium]